MEAMWEQYDDHVSITSSKHRCTLVSPGTKGKLKIEKVSERSPIVTVVPLMSVILENISGGAVDFTVVLFIFIIHWCCFRFCTPTYCP